MTYLQLITPLNIAEEKEKFFSSGTYAPQFNYKWDAASAQKYKQTNPELSSLIDALISQDKSAVQEAGSSYFDVVFRPQDIAFAQSLLQAVPKESNGSAQELASLMATKLRELGIDYRVEIVNKHGFQCRPDHKAKVIRFSKYLHLQFLPTESVANHELVHIIRAVNGSYNNIMPQPGYLPTEEGLACLVQDKLLKEASPSAFQHALEYMACYVSRENGFREVFAFLRDHGCDAESAWLRGIRQKFGLCDTSKPGGLMKSGMYFYHEQLLRELDKEKIVRLFVGKVPLAQLSNHATYTGALPRETIETLLG